MNKRDFRLHYERVMFCIMAVTPLGAEQPLRKRRPRSSQAMARAQLTLTTWSSGAW
jgi:hypothetical protein